MTLALFPLGLISIWQTYTVVKEAESLSRASLLARTEDKADEERRIVQEALGVAEGLAQVITRLSPEDCNTAMRKLVDGRDTYIFAGFVPLDGQMICSTANGPVDLRSEEHTSELQSLTNLVCRLLLEKKKKKNNKNHLASQDRCINNDYIYHYTI